MIILYLFIALNIQENYFIIYLLSAKKLLKMYRAENHEIHYKIYDKKATCIHTKIPNINICNLHFDSSNSNIVLKVKNKNNSCFEFLI